MYQLACTFVLIAAFISSSLALPQAQADQMPWMPIPGVMVHLSPEYTPAYLKGIVIHPENALKFDFIIYKGDRELSPAQKKEEYTKLTKYFLASLAIPDDDQWVNLSPYEKDRIIKNDFGKTEMGRDLLAQDYMLKQITASLIYPGDKLGKKFWDKVYTQAQQQYGTSNIPVNTFNKVWILPDDALIYEKGNAAYILKNHLRVMLEEDYLSLQKHSGIQSAPTNKTHIIASKIVKEIVLPELEREVNEDENFAALRQVYSGMLLATWFKRALKKSLLGQIYANKARVKGVDQDPKTNEAIYHQYLRAYKKGVFNFIKEDVDRYTNETIPRKYFSGGTGNYAMAANVFHHPVFRITGDGTLVNQAMVAEEDNLEIASTNFKEYSKSNTSNRAMITGGHNLLNLAKMMKGVVFRQIIEVGDMGIKGRAVVDGIPSTVSIIDAGNSMYFSYSPDGKNKEISLGSLYFRDDLTQMRKIRSVLGLRDKSPDYIGHKMQVSSPDTKKLVALRGNVDQYRLENYIDQKILNTKAERWALLQELKAIDRHMLWAFIIKKSVPSINKNVLSSINIRGKEMKVDPRVSMGAIDIVEEQILQMDMDILMPLILKMKVHKDEVGNITGGATVNGVHFTIDFDDEGDQMTLFLYTARGVKQVTLLANIHTTQMEKIRAHLGRLDRFKIDDKVIMADTQRLIDLIRKMTNVKISSPRSGSNFAKGDVIVHKDLERLMVDDSGEKMLISLIGPLGGKTEAALLADHHSNQMDDIRRFLGLNKVKVHNIGLNAVGQSLVNLIENKTKVDVGLSKSISHAKLAKVDVVDEEGKPAKISVTDTGNKMDIELARSNGQRTVIVLFERQYPIPMMHIREALGLDKINIDDQAMIIRVNTQAASENSQSQTDSKSNTDDTAKTGIDRAMKGGIDFNSANLSLQIKRDGHGVPLPLTQQGLENIKIDGLIPIIINIKPAAASAILSELQV